MIFVIGGEHQGKLDYVFNITEFKNGDVIDCLNIDVSTIDNILKTNKSIIYNFNILIRKLLEKYDDEEIVKEKIKDIFTNNSFSVVISNEIGYGIVPVDRFERRYRELTGRICCELAKEAQQVCRVVCGIGTVIKGR